MGTVGLSFGSATSGQGFDVASTVTQIQASEQAIETPWKTQLAALQAQDTVAPSSGVQTDENEAGEIAIDAPWMTFAVLVPSKGRDEQSGGL